METKILNYYKFNFDNQWVCGFYDVTPEAEYDFYGQMTDYPEVLHSLEYGGWFKFQNNAFIEDSVRKAEMIAKREEEDAKPTWQERTDAQVTYTAMMTDTLIDEEI